MGENLQTYLSKADEEEEADRLERIEQAESNRAMALRVLVSENQEDHEGRYYEFSTDITLGSSITNAVRVQGEDVSAVHARIEFRDGTPHLMDMSLDNAAGTRLQLQRPVVLRPRDVIILGGTEFDIYGIRDCPSLRAPWLAAALRITRRRKSSRFGFVNRFKLPCHYTEVGRDEETTIGREPSCDIVVRDFAMALRHAVVYYDRFDQTYCVESLVLSRKQGTFVLLGRRPAPLPPGACHAMGKGTRRCLPPCPSSFLRATLLTPCTVPPSRRPRAFPPLRAAAEAAPPSASGRRCALAAREGARACGVASLGCSDTFLLCVQCSKPAPPNFGWRT